MPEAYRALLTANRLLLTISYPGGTTKLQILNESSITHAHIKPYFNSELGAKVNGYSSVRYMRFRRKAVIDRLELGHCVHGRWIPSVPCHPAHVTVSVLDYDTGKWRLVADVELSPNPKKWGEGLSQEMPIEEMEQHFAAILNDPPHIIELNGIETDHLRIECDQEHPVWPNHGEMNGGTHNVPFGILSPLNAVGEFIETEPGPLPYHPILKTTQFNPSAPAGMQVTDGPESLLFESDIFSVAFSKRRPLIMHLGWDAFAEGRAKTNRLKASKSMASGADQFGGLSGPMLRTLHGDFDYSQWTGELEVEGNRVTYKNLKSTEGIKLDVGFQIDRDGMRIAISQQADERIPFLDYEAWRFPWEGLSGLTGAMALPTLQPGRNGDVTMPMAWSTDGAGILTTDLIKGDPDCSRLQVESYVIQKCVTGGFVLSPAVSSDECNAIPEGKIEAVFDARVTSIRPDADLYQELSPGVKRHWGSVFACFRPEFGGFSNHAASTNCHVNQGSPIEIITHTAKPQHGPNPLDMAKFTVGRALMGGGGYSYWRNLYMDSDPVLISTAGRIQQADGNTKWLTTVKPGLYAAIERIFGTIGTDGLAISRDLSGNSGSYRWSSNAMDVIGMGHIDAYVNAWTYRALMNTGGLFKLLGDDSLSLRCMDAAVHLRDAYAPALLNPETGWVAGWRSADGRLHDYAFLWVNGPAIAFGLLDPEQARTALLGLEQLRKDAGMADARAGLPVNLIPINREDHMLPKILGGWHSTFEKYTDGALSGFAGTYYLRALSIYGLNDAASKLADELDQGYNADVFTGPMGSGREFRTWDGIPTGYEGTLIVCLPQIYAIAVEKGIVQPAQPEWWIG